ncbi:MAG: N-acetylmuramoyl-L-alanine amidase [Chitinophagaceae bacterium]|nr:N-acetylmuramoyl-L-alanine amidase [Chitinophagaceae bacterium]
MIAIAYYILKVIICSGILLGYYRIALHNKNFHRWNRFYLLSAVVISLTLPLIKINVWHRPAADDGQIIKLLNVVTTGDEYVYEASRSGSLPISGEQVATGIYAAVSVFLFLLLLHTLVKLNRLRRRNPTQRIQQIKLVQTEAKGTPFSFFSYIFWNRSIDMHSATGKKIFTHEMVHVTEKHSADRLFINIVLVVCWCNPFFWLIQREINMIHEFIADSEAIKDSDTGAFAAMILHAAYPQQTFGLTSSFFSSSIKRRLYMLTKLNNPRINYFSRILALPLLTFIFVAFTVKTKQLLPNHNDTPITQLETPVTVVIDAGHGGDDGGALSNNGIREKNITLSLSKKIKALNKNKGIKIILSRDRDITQSVRDKVDFAVQQKPDLFISLHVGWENSKKNEKNTSGFEIYLSRNQTAYTKQAQLFGSLLAQEIESTYGKTPQMKQRVGKGLWVLDAPSVNYPSLLVECGYMSNRDDLAFITSDEKQEKIARDILTAIERFAKVNERKSGRIPPVQRMLSPSPVSDKPDTSAVFMQSAEVLIDNWDENEPAPLIIKDGKETALSSTKGTLPSSSSAIVYPKNNPTALKRFGDKAKNGVVVIQKTGERPYFLSDTIPRTIKSVDATEDGDLIIIYSDKKVEKITRAEAQTRGIVLPPVKSTIRLQGVNDSVLYFLNGAEISKKDMEKIFPEDIETINVLKDKAAIDKYGIKAKHGIIEITTKKTVPIGKQVITPDHDKIFLKVETEAQFPGGETAWRKFISAAISRAIDSLQDEGKTGTCVVQFIVDTKGNLSEVEAVTMQGTLLSRTVVDALKNGPKWIPAMQNGHKVTAYRRQPVTFQIARN